MNLLPTPGQSYWRISSTWLLVWISAFRYAALSVSFPGLRLSVLPFPGSLLTRDPSYPRYRRWRLQSRCNLEFSNLGYRHDNFALLGNRAIIAELLSSVPVIILHLRETTKPRPTFRTSTAAFIDSGAGGNFIDQTFSEQNQIPLSRKDSPVALVGIDNRPLTPAYISLETGPITLSTPSHKETLGFDVIHAPGTPITLGLPWLQKHNPLIDWVSPNPINWRSRSEKPLSSIKQQSFLLANTSNSLRELPSPYAEFLDVFSKAQSELLPPHRSYDCPIDLVPGYTLPKAKSYPLSLPETKAMDEYIRENLKRGFIRHSNSPAGAGFFFVKKKDESDIWLRPSHHDQVSSSIQPPRDPLPQPLRRWTLSRFTNKCNYKKGQFQSTASLSQDNNFTSGKQLIKPTAKKRSSSSTQPVFHRTKSADCSSCVYQRQPITRCAEQVGRLDPFISSSEAGYIGLKLTSRVSQRSDFPQLTSGNTCCHRQERTLNLITG
ncbi:uncharacterized protein LOC142503320 [Ascaphus truei]|uniref:uncharacterized protein LOC142503320 n=1 Tax=Ascaphus truei TaxID=8439 RepID=UPI003F5985CB